MVSLEIEMKTESAKPIIGIIVDVQRDPDDLRTQGKLILNWNYAQTVSDAGGCPILIPPQANLSQVSRLLDGWLIPGGNDLDASLYGEENHSKVELQDPARYQAESTLFDLVSRDLPIFGICYGLQFLNVKMGGKLEQHLPDILGHETHQMGTLQSYTIEPHSKLAGVLHSETASGKSYHHQAVRELAPGLKVVARSEDGVVEALESTTHPWIIAVQWHPERTMETQESQALFENFIMAASAYRDQKKIEGK